MPAFGSVKASEGKKGSARSHVRVGSALLLSVAVMLSSATAAVAANGYVNQLRSARAAAKSHCRASDFAMQCVRFGPGSAGAGTGSIGAGPTHAALTHASRVYKYGIDFAWRAVRARQARKMGARFAASYLSTAASKNWTRALIHAYHAVGLGTVCVWETTATRALARYAAGRTDARAALRQERALGVPASRPIYFAVDFNETARQARAVASYFRGVNLVLGVGRAGAYGSYWTIRRLFRAGLIRFGWQTSAWSGGRWDRRAQIQQYAYYNAYDWDRAMTSAFGATY
ncbi:MAG: glycoside hydrolase domain-containing protein [Solirubrobacteraceae bacterium]